MCINPSYVISHCQIQLYKRTIVNMTDYFDGFRLQDGVWPEAEQMDLTSETFGNVLVEFKDIIPCVIMGELPADKFKKVNLFAELIVLFSSNGLEEAVAFTPFINFQAPANKHLPVAFVSMKKKSRELFVTLLDKFAKYGFSESANEYLDRSRDEVERAASLNDCYAQFLMGFWYSFSNRDELTKSQCLEKRRDWYELAALQGFSLAITRVAMLFDDQAGLAVDYKKVAYFSRLAALQGHSHSAYNLACLYLDVAGISFNKTAANLWLSVALKQSKSDERLEAAILTQALKHKMKLTDFPDLTDDPELDPRTAELNDLYD